MSAPTSLASAPDAGLRPLVLITGASSGIGQALAQQFARSGWRLALVARRGDVLRQWMDDQGWTHEDAQAYAADVAQGASMNAVAQACIERQGLPDVVVANAGISVGMDSADPRDLAVLQDTMNTNVVGVAATFGPFLSPMRARRSGVLVGMASVAAIRGLPGHAAYCASKAAVVAFCESLRGECRGSGVRVMTLLPGYVATPLTARNKYPMPFLMGAEDFARRAYRAIHSGRSYQVIPWPMAVVAKLLRLLPNAWFDRLFAGRGRKERRSHDVPRA